MEELKTEKITYEELQVGDIIVVGCIPEYDEKVTSIKKVRNLIHLTVDYMTYGNVYKFGQPRHNRKRTGFVTIHARG